MLLKNYWELTSFFDIMPYYNNNSVSTGIKDADGQSVTLMCNFSSYGNYAYKNTSAFYDITPGFGTSDQIVDPDDYHLLSDVSSSFSNLSCLTTKSLLSTGREIQITMTGRNNSGSSKTIKEIGVYKTVVKNANNFQTSSILLLREVLETPITVPNGTDLSVTVKVKFSE